MSKNLQENGCAYTQAVQPSYFEVSDEAMKLFLQYQAARAGIAMNHDTVLLCNSTDAAALRIPVDAKVTIKPAHHDNWHTKKQAVSLCGHGLNGKGCSKYTNRPKPIYDHLSDPSEKH